MAKVQLSVDEIISIIKHSGVPTLLAEGVDDMVFLRRIEDKFISERLSVLPTGGRDSVLQVYDRRNEFAPHVVLFFMADKDTWVYSTVPSNYQDNILLLTDGYSIENDLYRNGDLEKLLTKKEKCRFCVELARFIDWYALALSRHMQDLSQPIAAHPTTLLDNFDFFDKEMILKTEERYPSELRNDLMADYKRLLRGKSLMALLVRQLSSKTRSPKHSMKSLMEYGAVAEGAFVDRVVAWMHLRLQKNGEAA